MVRWFCPMDLETALRHRFGPILGPRIGGGGEADVYALNRETVLRLTKPGTKPSGFRARNAVLDRIADCGGDIAIPYILETGEVADRFFTVETRLHGEPMDRALASITGHSRHALIDSYMETAARISDLLRGGPFGEIGREDPIVRSSQRKFMIDRVTASMAQGGLDLDPHELCAPFEEPAQSALVHLDYFPGNVMCNGQEVTGVLDFGYSTVMADARFTPVLAVIYLNNRITPPAKDDDIARGMLWLERAGYLDLVEPLRRWVAAYWSFCRDDDPRLAEEIGRVLRL